MSEPPFERFMCTGCGGPLHGGPRLERFFQSGGESVTPTLCWICTRLWNSVKLEAQLTTEFCAQLEGGD
jgi:hypothetical protein